MPGKDDKILIEARKYFKDEKYELALFNLVYQYLGEQENKTKESKVKDLMGLIEALAQTMEKKGDL